MSLTDHKSPAIVGAVNTYTILDETGNMINSYASRIEAYTAFFGLIPQHNNLALFGCDADGGIADSLVYERGPQALSAPPARPRSHTPRESSVSEAQRRREAYNRLTIEEDLLAWEHDSYDPMEPLDER
jgi:hypothetical protein